MLQFIALGVIFSISLTFQSISFAQEVFDETPVRERVQNRLGARVIASRAANAARFAQAQAAIQSYKAKRALGFDPQEPHPSHYAYIEEYNNYHRDENCTYISDHLNNSLESDCQLTEAPRACFVVMDNSEKSINEAQTRFRQLQQESRQNKANGTQLLKEYRSTLITQINAYKTQLDQCRQLLEPIYSQSCMASYNHAIPENVVEEVATQCTEGAVIGAIDDYVTFMAGSGVTDQVRRAKYQYGVARNNAIQLAETLYRINNFIQVLEGDLEEGRMRLPASSPRPVARPER